MGEKGKAMQTLRSSIHKQETLHNSSKVGIRFPFSSN